MPDFKRATAVMAAVASLSLSGAAPAVAQEPGFDDCLAHPVVKACTQDAQETAHWLVLFDPGPVLPVVLCRLPGSGC